MQHEPRDDGRAGHAVPDDPYWYVEALFFAYRDFTSDPDRILNEIGFGRAHHRVLHFVHRYPGMRVADLLEILQITKQSLARVLRELIKEGYVAQRSGKGRPARAAALCDGAGWRAGPSACRAAAFEDRRDLGPLGADGRAAVARFLAGMMAGTGRPPRRGSEMSPWTARPGRPSEERMSEQIQGASAAAAVPDDAPHILVVDDDKRIRDLLARFLQENGYRVSTAEDAAAARASMRGLAFDLMILDIMMPGETGLSLAQDLRTHSQIPILMLTARTEADDRIAGLEIGADDYMPKPFDPRELLLRMKNILNRRVQVAAGPQEISFGKFTFHPVRGELRADGEAIKLTEIERNLLRHFALRPGVAGRPGGSRQSVRP